MKRKVQHQRRKNKITNTLHPLATNLSILLFLLLRQLQRNLVQPAVVVGDVGVEELLQSLLQYLKRQGEKGAEEGEKLAREPNRLWLRSRKSLAHPRRDEARVDVAKLPSSEQVMEMRASTKKRTKQKKERDDRKRFLRRCSMAILAVTVQKEEALNYPKSKAV
jgi:hypothetical protein